MSAPSRGVAGGVQLVVAPEPLELRRALRALAEEEPRRAVAELIGPGRLAALLWDRWGPALVAAGLPEDAFLDVLAGYQRELWYWLWGNRTWAQCTQGLAGRLARRTPPRTSQPPNLPTARPIVRRTT